ncbi:MmgE/PrpD family protein [Polynucleobacter kasalickyi]|uniref:2-methylcitrate dehydratase PrpD n=1 Tax=Polynucleobacter kasalickyi TaxID=1938817 RepID=A0A1W1YA40_9BURK|nr:MmgE/PrpD family protein [Polynucleobacter kasalickyi]SMC33005.1 2-methylcitrate dehydratase PrpD [Polynucleobacter kasalickyi]
MTASEILANFCLEQQLTSIPNDVKAMAKSVIVDTVGVATYGSQFPWSQAIAKYATAVGSGGSSRVFGMANTRLNASAAALANGSFTHAFEQDSLRKPGAGVHPGATIVAPAWSVAEELGATGSELMHAVIIACEVMFRIGAASLHTSEKKGFHAPGLTGPYGSAIAAGILMKLNPSQLSAALGIAGSMSAGLLAFTKANKGADVKRLHLGRAAEAGIVAARLAKEGLEGPENILEGHFGFLESYCSNSNPELLTKDLGSAWETQKICLKAFPCHVTSHTTIESLRILMQEHSFTAAEVSKIDVEVSDKVLSHHVIRQPSDVKQAQYSLPFCVAWALYRDPYQPENMNESILTDAFITKMSQAMTLTPFITPNKNNTAWSSLLKITLQSGKVIERWSDEFTGSPTKPLTGAGLKNRFFQLTGQGSLVTKELWWDSLNELEQVSRLGSLPDLIYLKKV